MSHKWSHISGVLTKQPLQLRHAYFIASQRNAWNVIDYTRPNIRWILHDGVIKWKHFPRLQAICAGNSPAPGEFPAQRPVTRNFDVLFDLRLNKRLSK